MKNCRRTVKTQNKITIRLDEIMCEKANKHAVLEVEKEIKETRNKL